MKRIANARDMQVRWHKLQVHAFDINTGGVGNDHELFVHFKQVQHYKTHGVGIEIVAINSHMTVAMDDAAVNDFSLFTVSYGQPAAAGSLADIQDLATSDRCIYFRCWDALHGGAGDTKLLSQSRVDNFTCGNNGILICTPLLRITWHNHNATCRLFGHIYYKLVQLSVQEWITVANRQATDLNTTL